MPWEPFLILNTQWWVAATHVIGLAPAALYCMTSGTRFNIAIFLGLMLVPVAILFILGPDVLHVIEFVRGIADPVMIDSHEQPR